MNLVMVAGLAVGAIALRFARAHRRRKLLERTLDHFGTFLGGDPDGRARAALERDAGRVARVIRATPDLDPSRLTFIDSTDPYPYLAAGEIGVLENFLAPRAMVHREFSGVLEDALEAYRGLERRSLNPLSWISDLLFLPRDLLDFLGLYSDRTAFLVTWLQLLYWLLLTVGAVLGALTLAGPWL